MAMKYFKELDGAIWAFNGDGSQDESITETMVALTEHEVELHLNPPPTYEQLAEIENQWRAAQMPLALEMVTAFQMGDEDVPGTEQQWKEYWFALRKWTEDNPDFPDSSKRPVAPT